MYLRLEDEPWLLKIKLGEYCGVEWCAHQRWAALLIDWANSFQVRRDRSDFWEGIKAHNATVTCAIFAPHPEAIIKPELEDDDISSVHVSSPVCISKAPADLVSFQNASVTQDPMVEQRKKGCGYVLISADFNGAIKVFINKTKPKHSSLPYTAILD